MKYSPDVREGHAATALLNIVASPKGEGAEKPVARTQENDTVIGLSSL
jgi:hypothetical protein